MSDESSAETRAALRGEQNRGAKAQRCRGAKAKTGRVSCREKKEKNTSRNGGEKRSYIGSARAVLRVVIVATRTPIETHI